MHGKWIKIDKTISQRKQNTGKVLLLFKGKQGYGFKYFGSLLFLSSATYHSACYLPRKAKKILCIKFFLPLHIVMATTLSDMNWLSFVVILHPLFHFLFVFFIRFFFAIRFHVNISLVEGSMLSFSFPISSAFDSLSKISVLNWTSIAASFKWFSSLL